MPNYHIVISDSGPPAENTTEHTPFSSEQEATEFFREHELYIRSTGGFAIGTGNVSIWQEGDAWSKCCDIVLPAQPAGKAWVMMEHEEGIGAYGPYPEMHSPHSVYVNHLAGRIAEYELNMSEGHEVGPDWDPHDVEDERVYQLVEIDLKG